MEPFDEKDFTIFKIKAVPAYNTNKNFHPRENNWVGYILNLDSENYYITGDTDAFLDIEDKIDYLLIPIGGTYTFSYIEAPNYTNKLNPKNVIPTHYGEIVGDISLGDKFKKLIKNEINVIQKIEQK